MKPDSTRITASNSNTQTLEDSLGSIDFSHQYLADIAWIITSTPILDNDDFKALSKELITSPYTTNTFQENSNNNGYVSLITQKLIALNEQPEPLVNFINERQTNRVGFYYEALISFILQHITETSLLVEHLQIHQQGKTLGEIDFIYTHQSNPTIRHLETAVKFYLGASKWQTENHPYSHWLGPMTKDRLDLKTNHLTEHQSQTSKTAAFKEISESQNIPQPEQQEVLIQGYLFQHPDTSLELPNKSTTKTAKNTPFWIKASEQTKYLSNEDDFLILQKPYWLSGQHSRDNYTPLNQIELIAQVTQLFEQWNRPILVSLLKRSEQTGILHQEYNRCFIVPDNWAGNFPPAASESK